MIEAFEEQMIEFQTVIERIERKDLAKGEAAECHGKWRRRAA